MPTFGAQLVAISPQTPDQSPALTVEKAELGFTVLSDPAEVGSPTTWGSRSSRPTRSSTRNVTLGLDLTQVNAEGSTQLPRPTVLIVDRDFTVRFVDVQPDYTARTEVADILSARGDLAD